MNILVVGGAGYVGGGIVDNLKENHYVTVYDSLIYEESFRKDVDFVYGDVRDHDKLKKLLDKNVGEITENFEIFRGDKSYIQNAIAAVQGALEKKIKKKTTGHDPGSRNPNRSRSQHILYAGRKVD